MKNTNAKRRFCEYDNQLLLPLQIVTARGSERSRAAEMARGKASHIAVCVAMHTTLTLTVALMIAANGRRCITIKPDNVLRDRHRTTVGHVETTKINYAC